MGNNRKPGNRQVIKTNLKTSNRISVIYNNKETEMYINDFLTFFNNQGYNSNSSNGRFTEFSKTFTQAEVRTLNSANGGFGLELLPSIESNQIYVLNNVFIKYTATGGTFATANIWIYNLSSNSADYIGSTNSEIVTPITKIEHFNQDNDSFLVSGDPIYIYSSVEQSSFEGTWSVFFDYKILDIS